MLIKEIQPAAVIPDKSTSLSIYSLQPPQGTQIRLQETFVQIKES